jgi:hypothetical protein
MSCLSQTPSTAVTRSETKNDTTHAPMGGCAVQAGMKLRVGAAWILWGCIGRAPQGLLPGGTWEQSTTGAGPRTGLRGPGQLTRYVIWTTGLAVPGPAHHWDGPQGEPIRHSSRRAT